MWYNGCMIRDNYELQSEEKWIIDIIEELMEMKGVYEEITHKEGITRNWHFVDPRVIPRYKFRVGSTQLNSYPTERFVRLFLNDKQVTHDEMYPLSCQNWMKKKIQLLEQIEI